MNINIKKVDKCAIIPSKGSKDSAGYDLYACYTPTNNGEKNYTGVVIPPGDRRIIGTGIAMEIPQGYFGGLYARSGLACKKGIRPATCTSVIDSDYRGEIMIFLYNDSNQPREVRMGERIAQLIIQPYLEVEFNEVDKLTDTDRGNGGFGSSGTR